jgi:hypothetical protein
MADRIQSKLTRAIEKRKRAYLWTPADAIAFVPRVLPTVYGDGRALFAIATINQRPAYWVIRACSSWGCGLDREDSSGPDFAEMTDQIMSDLEGAFGRGRCGYSGNSLFWPRKDRVRNCRCEECTDRHTARWPAVDDNGGCSWSRIDWPDGFRTVKNPLSWRGSLLVVAAKKNAPHSPQESASE